MLVHSASRKFLSFVFQDQTFQFKVICFGLTTTSQLFTKVMAPVLVFMHRQGYRTMKYLDDWLVLGFIVRTDMSSEGLPSFSMQGSRDQDKHGVEQADSCSICVLFGDGDSVGSFEDIPISGETAKASSSN